MAHAQSVSDNAGRERGEIPAVRCATVRSPGAPQKCLEGSEVHRVDRDVDVPG